MIKVVLADDHPVYLDGLEKDLKELSLDIEVVGTACDGDGVLELLKKEAVDVAVLDIGMLGMRKAETLKEIVEHHKHVRVLILTTYDDGEHIKMMINAGARGYVLKNLSGKEIFEAISTVHKGKAFFSQGIADSMLLASTHPDGRMPEPIKITDREADILRLLADDLAAKEIADKLNVAEATVVTHKRNLLNKLNLKSDKGLVSFAIKNGYTSDSWRSLD